LDGIRKASVFVERGEGFGKDHVGTSGDILLGAMNCGMETFYGSGIRPGHENKLRVGLGGHGGLESSDHFFGGDKLFARPVTASFRTYLIFEMDTRDTRSRHFAHGSSNTQLAAPAGIRVH
jgi:hypothetical protein